jgi:sulfate/thiosulfate transport system ATP-binding protein
MRPALIGGATRLLGRVQGAALGALSVAAPDGVPDGAAVQAFVRPHDVRIGPAGEREAVALARIERLIRVGGQVKLELRLPTGDAVTVQMSKAEVDALAVAEGDRVMVDLVSAQVFVEDYSI